MAATISFSSIVKLSLTSSNSLAFLHSNHTKSFFSPNPTKPFLKPLFSKPHDFTLTPLILPLHLCHCASSTVSNDIESSVIDELEEESELSEVDENDEYNEYNEYNEKASHSSDDGKLYVGNLPYTMTSSQLSEIFSQAGQVKSVEIVYDKITDRSRGFAFVKMESVDEAKEAIRMFDASQIGGRTVRVNFPEVPKGGEGKMIGTKVRIGNQSFVDTPHKIYAGNLGWGVTTQGLRDAFEDQPGFVSAKVIYERDSGRSRGFGFISFSTLEAAQSALTTLNGMELEGRPLRLNLAADRSRPNTAAGFEQNEVVSAVNS